MKQVEDFDIFCTVIVIVGNK